MREETVDNILSVGAELIFESGYNGVGLTKILETANIPKGSFYYYFKSKEDFGLKVIEFFTRQNVDFLKTFLDNRDVTPKRRIFNLFQAVMKIYQDQEYGKGCLLGNSSLELGGYKDVFAETISNGFNAMELVFEQTIVEGQEQGDIKTEYSAKEYAAFILNSWEGALVRMKSTRDDQPMNLFIQFIEKLL
ncbi:MAG: TetR family transcriptional regulator C-terminal domain-containing protein [Cytophagales bacterium]|nr:TetR family transcriptional regulator C-terminal domain-containing protein [Cytophagales bacterium]